MNTKFTLFKNDDFYYLIIGQWIDVNKAGYLHLNHGIFSADELDQITRTKQAVFDWNERYKIYEYHTDNRKKVGNRETIDQLYLYPTESNKHLYKGRFRKGKSTIEVARLRKELEIETAKPCTDEGE